MKEDSLGWWIIFQNSMGWKRTFVFHLGMDRIWMGCWIFLSFLLGSTTSSPIQPHSEQWDRVVLYLSTTIRLKAVQIIFKVWIVSLIKGLQNLAMSKAFRSIKVQIKNSSDIEYWFGKYPHHPSNWIT